ncbi:MAG: zf-HC2 domain-containing protein [Planctomycetes bacterium]|nr:zf-HC2 domain-containing protein [Planctomycetota bacterium]
MSCRRIRRLLPSFVGEDLPGPIATRLREHLRDCHPCAREFAAEREARLVLRESLRTPEPPADLWQRIESQLAPGSGVARPLRRPFPIRRVAAAGILLAATLAGSLAYFGTGGNAASPLPGAGDGASALLERGERNDEGDYPGFLRPVGEGGAEAPEFFTIPVGDTLPVSNPAGGVPAGPLPTQLRPAAYRPIRRDF